MIKSHNLLLTGVYNNIVIGRHDIEKYVADN